MPDWVIDVHVVIPAAGQQAGVLVDDASDGALPHVRPKLRADDTLVVAVDRDLSARFGLRPHILETYLPPQPEEGVRVALAVLEPPTDGWWPPDGLSWSTAVADAPGPIRERAAMWLEELLTGSPPPPLRARWSRPGFSARATSWIDGALRAAGRPRNGEIEVRRLWAITSLMRVPTEGGPAWFKGVFGPFGHEPAVTRTLARAHPALLPRVLAVEEDEGWMLLDDVGGDQLGMSTDTPAITAAVQALARLQDETRPLHDELTALGGPRRPLRALADELAEAVEDAPALGAATPDAARVDELLRWVADRANWLESIGLPETIVHGDFNRANVLTAPEGPVIIDWSDAAISHPLLDVTTWLLHPEGRFGRDDPSWPTWLDALGHLGDVHLLENELETVFGLGAAYQVVSYVGILRNLEPAIRYQFADDLAGFLRLLDRAVPTGEVGTPAA